MKKITLVIIFFLACFIILFAFLIQPHPKTIVKTNRVPNLMPTSPITIPKEMKLPIVMYHYVEVIKDTQDKHRIKLNINPNALNQQLKLFQDKGYISYFVKDIPELFRLGKAPDARSIVLTFDDGYDDVYINAFPLLKKYNMKATLYIVTNSIGRKGYLTKDQIAKMLQSGLIEVGAHTLDHADLTHLPFDKAKKEILNSKRILEDEFNISVKTFAYPGGALNDQVVEIVKEASYEAAVSTKPGVILRYDNLLSLPRIRPGFVTFTSVIQLFDKLHF